MFVGLVLRKRDNSSRHIKNSRVWFQVKKEGQGSAGFKDPCGPIRLEKQRNIFPSEFEKGKM